MSKTYLVDSENVGESWIDLLGDDESQFLIFYTEHSPRIDYEHVVRLINSKNEIEFIHCYKGNNALDFQSVSYLGYLLCSKKTGEMIIVSNDTGFDAVVNFWKEQGLDVKRLATNFIELKDIEIEEEPVSSDELAILQTVEVNAELQGVDRKELYTIVNCLGTSNPSYIHLALTHFYGNVKGREIYKHMKMESFNAPATNWKSTTKLKKFCELIFQYCNSRNISVPSDIYAFFSVLVEADDDKSTIHSKLNQRYGNQATELHKILKPFYKAIVKIK
ncbi:MAG: hypothetical protein IJS61_09740 [Firmicutes bacterium]|nr:hypothetical protein [Bacillota bacterium]